MYEGSLSVAGRRMVRRLWRMVGKVDFRRPLAIKGRLKKMGRVTGFDEGLCSLERVVRIVGRDGKVAHFRPLRAAFTVKMQMCVRVAFAAAAIRVRRRLPFKRHPKYSPYSRTQ